MSTSESKDGGSQVGDVHVAAALRSKKNKHAVIHAERVLTDEELRGGMFEKKVVPKSKAEKEMITAALKQNVLFEALGKDDMVDIMNAMSPVSVPKGKVVIKQGDPGDNFYVIEKGVFDILVKDAVVATFGDGTIHKSFGELALLYNSPRAATVVAKSDSKLWAIDRILFKRIIASTAHEAHTGMKRALRRVHLLADLTEEQIAKIAQAATPVQFNENHHIITKGEPGEVFYIIARGQVICKNLPGMQANNRLYAGDYFGERALLTSEPRACDVYAETDCSLMALHRDDFESLLGHLKDVLEENQGMRLLLCEPFVARLSDDERFALFSDLTGATYEAGAMLIERSAPVRFFYIVRDGIVEVRDKSGKCVKQYGPGDWFGEELVPTLGACPSNVVAKTSVTVFTLTQGAYIKLLKPLAADMRELKAAKSREIRAKAAADARAREEAAKGGGGGGGGASTPTMPPVPKTSKRTLEDIPFKELDIRETLGTGTFARVRIVWHAKSKRSFALKTLKKARIVELRQEKNVMNERKILGMVDHPFVLRLYNTYKDDQRLYMLMELVQGGELFSRLQSQRGHRISADEARFYGGCVLDAFGYLHARNIVYRDTKPENLLIDNEGYIRVADFGFAKIVRDRTYTLCGTPEYLAPELVLGKGHHKGVDYWALGILLYEMVVGRSPFADKSGAGDQMVICRNILRGAVDWHRRITPELQGVIAGLLEKDMSRRFGCRKGGADEIKKMKYFAELDFDRLYRKEIPAPWKPKLKDALDSSAFDPYDESTDKSVYKSDRHGDWDKDF